MFGSVWILLWMRTLKASLIPFLASKFTYLSTFNTKSLPPILLSDSTSSAIQYAPIQKDPSPLIKNPKRRDPVAKLTVSPKPKKTPNCWRLPSPPDALSIWINSQRYWQIIAKCISTSWKDWTGWSSCTIMALMAFWQTRWVSEKLVSWISASKNAVSKFLSILYYLFNE